MSVRARRKVRCFIATPPIPLCAPSAHADALAAGTISSILRVSFLSDLDLCRICRYGTLAVSYSLSLGRLFFFPVSSLLKTRGRVIYYARYLAESIVNVYIRGPLGVEIITLTT